MTFVINAIKQGNEQQNIEFLLLLDSQLFARKLIEKSGLVLLSMKDYKGDKESFGTSYVKFSYENTLIESVLKKDMTLKEAVSFFISIGFDVVDCNTFTDPQSVEQIQKVISFCKNQSVQQEQEKDEREKKSQESEKKIYYGNEMLDKSKVVINWIIDKIDGLLKDKGAYIPSRNLRNIKDKIEELKKLRMGANYERIRDLLQDLFQMVDDIEENYFSEAEKTALPIFDGTVVNNIDLERQINILEKVKQQQQFGGKIAVQRKDYVAFGEILVFLIFLKKDLLNSLKKFSNFLLGLFDYIQIGIIMILILVGMYLPINKILVLKESVSYLYYSLFSLGLLGLGFYIVGYFAKKEFIKKSMIVQFLLLLVIVFVYWISLQLIKNSFIL